MCLLGHFCFLIVGRRGTLMMKKNTVFFSLHGVNYLSMSGWPTRSSHISAENKQWSIRPTFRPPPSSPPAHPTRPSTNAQRSWTALILGIILYEIDGWGQPLTERVKTTLRCPLWISMIENRLLKKIYVCSPLPQNRAAPHPLYPVTLWPIKHVIVFGLNFDAI